jgi:hypothetical protein
MISDAAVAAGGPKAPEPPRGIMYDLSHKKLNQRDASTLTRLEVSEVLTNEYLYAKQSWELERDMLTNNASQVSAFSCDLICLMARLGGTRH